MNNNRQTQKRTAGAGALLGTSPQGFSILCVRSLIFRMGAGLAVEYRKKIIKENKEWEKNARRAGELAEEEIKETVRRLQDMVNDFYPPSEPDPEDFYFFDGLTLMATKSAINC